MILNFFSFLICILGIPFALSSFELPSENKPIVVVVVSYNNIKWVNKNISSILSQDYPNFRIVYIDDCSNDGTSEAVTEITNAMEMGQKLTLVRNQTRNGALANHYKAVHEYCFDNEIVVCVDGDDWLSNEHVLSTVEYYYATQDVWLTHGSLMEYHLDQRNGTIGWSIPVPDSIIKSNDFRSYRCPTHLKTFYAWLFKQIKKEDLMDNGSFFPVTGDQAIMFPMLEMAGERHAFIPEILYIYNLTNPIGDSIVATEKQRSFEHYIRNKKKYDRLPSAP